jgi:hypothetical protein
VALRWIALWLAFLVLLAGISGAYVFDSIDVSSKARGMGGAWVAGVEDATAIFYNPGALAVAGARNVYASYLKPNSQDFESLTFLAVSIPISENHCLGVAYRQFGVEYKDTKLLGESTFSAAYGLCLLKDIHSELYLGGGINLYSLDFGSTGTVDLGEETTLGVDVGFVGVLRQRTRIGFLAKNINEPAVGKGTREPLPQWITAGIAYEPYYGVTTELDVRSLRGEETEIHMGMAFDVTDYLGLRFGFETQPSSLTGGLTVGVERLEVDYSYSSHSVLPGTHHVALGARF